MGSLPIVRGTSAALYPFTQVYVAHTGVSDAQNGATARFVAAPPTMRFELPYNPLLRADKNTLKTFFSSAKGQFATNLSVTTDATYSNLSLTDDTFSAIEQTSTRYGLRWTLAQTLAQNLSPGSSGGAYPTLSNGAMCQLPYTQRKRFQSITSSVPSGPKYSTAEFGGGLYNYPTDGLMGWQLEYRALPDADVSLLVAHFLANWGDCFPFTFTDEDSTTYSNVFYGSPELSINRQQYGLSSLTTVLLTTNN